MAPLHLCSREGGAAASRVGLARTARLGVRNHLREFSVWLWEEQSLQGQALLQAPHLLTSLLRMGALTMAAPRLVSFFVFIQYFFFFSFFLLSLSLSPSLSAQGVSLQADL